MIEPKPGSDEKWLPVSQSLGGGYENLFFHADVAEQPSAKLIVCSLIDRPCLRHSRLQQSFEPPVVFHKKVVTTQVFRLKAEGYKLSRKARTKPFNTFSVSRSLSDIAFVTRRRR
jgi:hypothetical protein